MNSEQKLNDKVGRDSGFRVPDGFFEFQYAHISASLPPYTPAKHVKLSRWHSLRPYVYLAAMFAGIWCMMKIFNDVRQDPKVSLENIPVQVSEVIYRSPEMVELYSDMEPSDEYALEKTVIDQYDTFSAFEKDFKIAAKNN